MRRKFQILEDSHSTYTMLFDLVRIVSEKYLSFVLKTNVFPNILVCRLVPTRNCLFEVLSTNLVGGKNHTWSLTADTSLLTTAYLNAHVCQHCGSLGYLM